MIFRNCFYRIFSYVIKINEVTGTSEEFIMITSVSKIFSDYMIRFGSQLSDRQTLIVYACKNVRQTYYFHNSAVDNMARRWKKEIPFQSELTNPVEVVYGGDKKAPDDVGVVFDKIPFKISVKKYHLYTWCGCGRAHSQPFCDGTCTSMYLKRIIKGGPVKYIAPEDRDIWFCMCKQVSSSFRN